MFKQATEKQFNLFRNFFPFSCVDLVIIRGSSVFLTKRKILPYKGKWHFPGGLIRKNESMHDSVHRIAKNELNSKVTIKQFLGTFENLNRYRHDISHCFLCTLDSDSMTLDFQSSQGKFFKRIPSETIAFHKAIIKKAFTEL